MTLHHRWPARRLPRPAGGCAARLRAFCRIFLLFGSLFGTACKSDQQKAEDKRQTIRSWQSTLRMADSAAARHELPPHLLARVRATARQEIAKAAKQ